VSGVSCLSVVRAVWVGNLCSIHVSVCQSGQRANDRQCQLLQSAAWGYAFILCWSWS